MTSGAARVVGEYEIEGELRRAGMGVVFRVWQRKLKRVVALKMLSGYYGPPELKRFFAEAETAQTPRNRGLRATAPASFWDSLRGDPRDKIVAARAPTNDR